MAKKNNGIFSNKSMAIMLFVALGIQFVLPVIGLSMIGWIATLLTLLVAIMLLIK